MTHGNTTVKIQSARIAYLTAEVARLRRENERLRRALAALDYTPTPEPPTPHRDYGLGGDEWTDPKNGLDTWTGENS
jgi:hypothetical protein